MSSLLPGLNFNAAWTHSSNDHLMNKTNLEYGSVMGANLLNVFMYPKVKRINETNTEVIREKRLALSMAVLSQVHLANIDYSLALEEYDTAERYYQVSRKITEQIKNAQKIARFGNLELIREQARDGEGRTTYDAFLSNDKPLPSWITFLPSQKTFLINNLDKDNTEELKIKVIAKNIDTRIEDTFTLMVDPELRATRLKNEKRLEEQRKLAKKRKQEEIERLKAEKILKEKQAKEEALELARKQAEETLRQEQEKIQLEKQQQEELLAKQKANLVKSLKLNYKDKKISGNLLVKIKQLLVLKLVTIKGKINLKNN